MMIITKNKELMNNETVRDYLKTVEAEIIKSLEDENVCNKLLEAVVLGMPFSFNYDESSGKMTVIVHYE